jgi:endonuclease/exonuclease/phosphatase family metal-dependent hydrolase
MRLRLVSWNLHGTPTSRRRIRRMRACAAELLRRRPDLILLQEVWRRDDARLLVHDLGEAWLPLDVPPGGLGRRGGLLAFASRSRRWRAESHFEPFRSEAPAWKLWEGDGLGDKGIQRLDLEGPEGRLVVLNTHLQAAYRPGGYAEVRRAQLEQLGAAVARVEPDLPVLAAGDLNTRPDEPLFAATLERFEDLTAPLRRACGGCGTVPGRSDWIDYVLWRRSPAWQARAESELIRSARADVPFSDHHGLDARITLWPARRSDAPPAARALAGPATRRAWLMALGRALVRAAAPAWTIE